MLAIPRGRNPSTNINGQILDSCDDVKVLVSEESVFMLNISGSSEMKRPVSTMPVHTRRARLTPENGRYYNGDKAI